MQKYMNIKTGSVNDYDGWWFDDGSGASVNAVDLGEVVPVIWDGKEQCWVEGEEPNPAAVLGKKGGSAATVAKQAASRENGRKGGRPRYTWMIKDRMTGEIVSKHTRHDLAEKACPKGSLADRYALVEILPKNQGY